MRLLFEMDAGDHGDCTRTFVRNSARAVILRGEKALLVFSRKYGYYKFPGGGIEKGETPEEALVRELRAETGVSVVPGSVREYGMVRRIQRDKKDPRGLFLQDNYYFLCEAGETEEKQDLDEYEAEEGFVPALVRIGDAVLANREKGKYAPDPVISERDARVLEMLLVEHAAGKE